MTGIEQVLGQPWSQRLGWSLVHFLWQGLVIAAMSSVAMAALRRRSARLRYALACTALLVMAAAPAVTFCVIPAGPTRDAPPGPAEPQRPDLTMAPGQHKPPAADWAPSAAASPDSVPDASPAEAPAEAVFPPAGPVEPPDAGRQASPAAIGWAGRASRFVQPALPWTVAVWAAGVAALAIWHMGGWVGLLRLRRSALPLGQGGPEARCAQAAGRIARQLGFSRAIRLLESARIAGPVAVGILRPAVLMPVTMLTGLSAPHIEAILAHEIAHLRRYDYLVNLLQSLVETVLFYHPAVWWVSGRIRVERENCCDDVAVGVCGDRATYVAALACLAESSAGVRRARLPRLAAARRLATGASFGVLFRIRRLLGLPGSNAAGANRWLAGVLIVVCLAVAGALLRTNTETTVAATAPVAKEDKAEARSADPKVTVEKTKDKCGFVGRVIDAETGKAVEKFAIRTGWTDKPVTDAKDIRWYPTTYGGHPDGKFSISHCLPDDRRQFVYFRILANGYLPQLVSDKPLSRPLRHRGVVVRLRRGGAISGRVLDHTGKPVAGANVFLVGGPGQLELVDGKPERFTGSSGKTDKDGRFKLPGAGEMTTHVVVSCKSLHAWLTRIPKAGGEMSIKLPAPAAAILKYDIPGAATDRLRLALATYDMPKWKGIFCATGDIVHRRKVAQGGAVALGNLTPGLYDVSRYVTARVGLRGQGLFCDRRWIELKGGETTGINFVRKTGVAIVGDIPGLAANGFDGAFIRIEETTVRPGLHSYMGPILLDFLACGGDGKFKTCRIPPGRYNVIAEAYLPEDPTGRIRTGLRRPELIGSAKVTVPAAGEPVQVRVLMKPWQRPQVFAKALKAPATAAARERCWRDMTSEAYTQASGAAAALGIGGDEAAEFLSGKLLTPPADPARMKQLIAQLDSPRYKVREEANADLKALEMAAMPGLRTAAKGSLSAEARARIKALLAREPALLMRMERAIDVLAGLDRSRCLQVLRTLAAGDADAPGTKLAKARLRTLLARPAKPATTKPADPKVTVKRAKGLGGYVGRVLDPIGKPVAGADVFLVSRKRQLGLLNGKPGHFTGSSGRTDKDGRFKLPGDGETATHVAVSCKSLHAWVTGIPKAGGEVSIKLPAPAAAVLAYDIPGAATGRFRLALVPWDMPQWKGIIKADTTDEAAHKPSIAQGNTVTLRSLTPGVYDVGRYVRTRVGDLRVTKLCDRRWIELKSGETTGIDFVRKTGVAIAGDIPGLAANGCDGAFISIKETTVRPGRHSNISPTILDFLACGPDGKFRTSRIPPGRYNVTVEAHLMKDPAGPLHTGERAPGFVGSAEVTVPVAGEPVWMHILMQPARRPGGGPGKAPEAPTTAAARQRCWEEMGTADYAKTFRAAAALGVGGDKAAKFLAEKLLIAPADPGLMKKLIAQLDAPQYNVRRKAQADLKALDAAALPGLRAAAKGDLSGEAQTRVTMLLAREAGFLMRMERAIAILAGLDRPRCVQVLRTLTQRDPDAPETRLAKAGLKRINLAQELLGRILRTWRPGVAMSLMVSSTMFTTDSPHYPGWVHGLVRRGERITLARASKAPEVQAFVKLGPRAARACNQALPGASPGPDATALTALLGIVGDEKSVPLLINMHARSGKIKSEPSLVTHIATTWALWRLTGRELVMTSEGWNRWWQAVGEGFRLPRDRASVEVTEARVRPLVAALSRKDDELVRERLVALGPNVAPHLVKAMRNVSDYVRYRLAWAVDEAGRTRDIPADIRRAYFIQRLGRERKSSYPLAKEARKRALTAQSFADFCRTALPVDCEPGRLAGEADFKKALNAEGVDLDTAVAVLVPALADSDKAIRDRAAKLAATVGAFSDAAPAKLIDALTRRWRAEPGEKTTMHALSRFETPGVRRVIVDGLHSENEKVILACLRAAADTALISAEKAAEIAPTLTALTSHENVEIRIGGAEVLARRAPALLRPHLERLCRDNPEIGRHCAAAMGQLKDPNHAQLLVKLAGSTDSIARHNALKALGDRTFRRAIPSLVPLLWKSGHQYNDACMWTIANAGGPQAVAVFLDELRKGQTCGGTIYDALEKVTGKRFKRTEQVQAWWWAGGMDMDAPAVKHVRLTDEQLGALWRQLASTSFLKRYQAILSIRSGGDRAAAFLAGRLGRAPAEAGRIAALIGQLGSEQWRVRQKAQADLEALDMAALPGLRVAAKGDLSAEARTRVKSLLAREPALLMRMERAIDVLARLDRPRCLQVLRKLAAGDPNAPETKLAEARLQALLTRSAAGAKAPAASLSDGELLRLWDRIGQEDPKVAYAAVAELAGGGDRAVAMLRRRLDPVLRKADRQGLRQLMGELDHEQYSVRSRASEQLRMMGRSAAPTLRAALYKTESLEARLRLEALVRESESLAPATPARRRVIRAACVLERIGTKQAAVLLKAVRASQARPCLRCFRKGRYAVEAGFVPDQAEYVWGEPMYDFTFVLTNVGDVPVSLTDGPPTHNGSGVSRYGYFTITAVAGNGRAVADPWGMDPRAGMSIGPVGAHVVRPGQTYTKALRAGSYLTFPGPGEYTVTGARAPWSMRPVIKGVAKSDPVITTTFRLTIRPHTEQAIKELIARLGAAAASPVTPAAQCRRAARALADLKNKACVPHLLGGLKMTDAGVRAHCLRGLSEFRTSSVEAAIAEALSDADSNVRSAAVDALGRAGSPTAFKLVVKALGDKHSHVVETAAAALAGRGPEAEAAIPQLLAALRRVNCDAARPHIVRALTGIGRPSVGPLLQAMTDENPKVRSYACAGLAEMKVLPKTAVPVFVTALNDTQASVRRDAARTLKRIAPDTSAARAGFLRLLEDENRDVGWVAFEALRQVDPQAHVDRQIRFLIGQLDGGDLYLSQARAAELLGRMGPRAKAAVPQLRANLEHRYAGVVWSAYNALRKIQPGRGAEHLPLLIRKLECDPKTTHDPTEFRRQAASAVLGLGSAGKPAAAALVTALRNENRNVDASTHIARVLLAVGRPEGDGGIPALLAMLADGRRGVLRLNVAHVLASFGAADRGVPVLIAGLKDKGWYTRAVAAKALGDVGGRAEKSLPALTEALGREKDDRARREIEAAIGKVRRAAPPGTTP